MCRAARYSGDVWPRKAERSFSTTSEADTLSTAGNNKEPKIPQHITVIPSCNAITTPPPRIQSVSQSVEVGGSSSDAIQFHIRSTYYYGVMAAPPTILEISTRRQEKEEEVDSVFKELLGDGKY